ncbi:glycosyltransferase [Nodosilinea sp. LEGE 07088]|nr:glycosyltransferase [Nodosilinea sp. LEGE 07088]
MHLADLRCICCGGGPIVESEDVAETLRCAQCDRTFTTVLGVPFLGHFEQEDVLGLIEIAANIDNRGKFGITPAVVEHWEQTLAAYHRAADRQAFAASNPDVASPYFLNRYGEWLEVTRLLENVDLHGAKVLDIGAGLGFDSHRLAMRGAAVTALEFSPLLAEAGHINFPHIRWIGGFSHFLPFQTGSFDAVFCNAALHHMRDIPAALSEALRVLRPGGALVTTCDSFRPSGASEQFELGIFDREPAVLLGVNEGIPRFSEFTELLQQQAAVLAVDLYTHTLYNAPTGGTLTDLTRWRFPQDLKMLASRSGSIALRVTLQAVWPLPGRLQEQPLLSADDYVDWLLSSTSAIAKLAPLIPDQYVDLPFPGTKGSKFELLNGWRLRGPGQSGRTAYRRGRWFLRRPAGADTLRFELALPGHSGADCDLEVRLDGIGVGTYRLANGVTQKVTVDIAAIPIDSVFALEIRRLDEVSDLDEGNFEVYRRRFVTARPPRSAQSGGADGSLAEPKVFAIIPVFNRLHFTETCIQALRSQTYQPLTIIVADGGSTDGTVETLRDQYPEVVVLTADTELWWAGSMAQGISYALGQSQNPDDYVLMMNNDTDIPADYVATLVDAAQTHDAAVGALIVDSRDPDRILDAGEYVDWPAYTFPVKTTLAPGETFCDDVDVLPGRGSLVPLEMIRTAGNVDSAHWPHYLADYEFFYRLKQAGYQLGVCYDTRLLAHIEATGLIPGAGVVGFGAIWQELFSRRSMSNVVDHWRFVQRHAPAPYRLLNLLRLSRRVAGNLAFRTPLRPFCLPFYWAWRAVQILVMTIKLQAKIFVLFGKDIRDNGVDVLCYPHRIPKLIRIPVYLLLCPGPVRHSDCQGLGLAAETLVGQGILRRASVIDWYCLNTFKITPEPRSPKLKSLVWMTLNPVKKIANTLTWKSMMRKGSQS